MLAWGDVADPCAAAAPGEERGREAQVGPGGRGPQDKAVPSSRRRPANSDSGRRRHAAAYLLWGLAGVLAIVDFLEYTGTVRLMSTDLANLLLGLPAAMLAIGGAIVYGT